MASLELVPSLSLRASLLLPLASGLATHLVYKKFEINPSIPFTTVLLLFVVPLASSLFLFHHYPSELAAVAGFSVFYATLLSSIVLYRISPWHPLAKYPGPLPAKISQFWLARATMNGNWHEILKELHAQYGSYVRVGPNQLSFIDASLIPKIMGPDGMPKGPMFDGARMSGVPANVIATRDLRDHTQKRKPWATGLNTTSVREYTTTIKRRTLQLAEELEKSAQKRRDKGRDDSDAREQKSVDLVMWFSRFSFDFMGDMAFGGAFELMRDGDTSGIWTLINKQMKTQAVLHRLPWCTHLVQRLPVAIEVMATFTKFVNDCVNRRLQRGPRQKDLLYHLANEDAGPNAYGDFVLLTENVKVAIIAGSDTTSTTLSNMFYYLLTNPDVLVRLRAEVDEVFPPGEGDPFDFVKLSELSVMNAVINETLRLQPPVPTDLQRSPTVGSGTKQIGEHIIPEGTSINVPPYVLHRQSCYFYPNPESFWIDRWLQTFPSNDEKAGFIHDTSAYIPFSYGPANCVGKMLALAELRSVTALILQRFDISFEPGYDPARWERERESHFVFRLGPLPVVLTMRSLE